MKQIDHFKIKGLVVLRQKTQSQIYSFNASFISIFHKADGIVCWFLQLRFPLSTPFPHDSPFIQYISVGMF